jgi:dTDP-4-dehydrorhamnose reductase
MRCLILGGDGMLGHQLMAVLGVRNEVRCTLRRNIAAYARHGRFSHDNAWFDVDARDQDRLLEIVGEFRPEVIVNAVGVVKQRPEALDVIASLEINAVLPHRLAVLCKAAGARLVHVSTDCVFDGKDGGYTEDSPPNATDLYGMSKRLGEVGDADCLTLRTSIVGLELSRKTGLLEWFLAEQGPVRGFRKAVFSGLTTTELSRVIDRLIREHPQASGLWHVSGDPIDKHTLLTIVRDEFGLSTEIIPDETVVCDRSLDSSRFRREFGYTPPGWDVQIGELADQARGRAP